MQTSEIPKSDLGGQSVTDSKGVEPFLYKTGSGRLSEQAPGDLLSI